MDQVTLYRHRQIGWAILISAIVPMVLLFWFTYPNATSGPALKSLQALDREQPWLLIGPLLLIVVPVLFSSLEVAVERSVVRLRFGPFGLVRKSWPIASIEGAAATRTTLWQGWGIHRRRGVTIYNVSGFQAVRLTLKSGRAVLVGSDDAATLAATINRLVAHR